MQDTTLSQNEVGAKVQNLNTSSAKAAVKEGRAYVKGLADRGKKFK
jgi:hypothetical protein